MKQTKYAAVGRVYAYPLRRMLLSARGRLQRLSQSDTIYKVMLMKYDKELVVHKLIRWERYLQNYQLPTWKEIPDIGLYMDQMIALLTGYLDFIPTDKPSERPITPTTINNYVRLKVMPAPEKRKYYRSHIAYLIVIFTLKQSVSISCVQKVIPADLTPEQVRAFYSKYVETVGEVGRFFTQQTRVAAQDLLAPDAPDADERATDSLVDGLIIQTMLMAGFSGILAEKLLQLQGADKARFLADERDHTEK